MPTSCAQDAPCQATTFRSKLSLRSYFPFNVKFSRYASLETVFWISNGDQRFRRGRAACFRPIK